MIENGLCRIGIFNPVDPVHPVKKIPRALRLRVFARDNISVPTGNKSRRAHGQRRQRGKQSQFPNSKHWRHLIRFAKIFQGAAASRFGRQVAPYAAALFLSVHNRKAFSDFIFNRLAWSTLLVGSLSSFEGFSSSGLQTWS
jgi:hypothetical protein